MARAVTAIEGNPIMHRLSSALLSLLLLLSTAIVCADATPAVSATVPNAAVQQAPAPVAVPEPSPLAVQYYHSGNWLWIATTLWGLLVPAALLFSGLSARMRSLAARIGRRWYFTLALYYLLFTLVYAALNVPLDWYTDFARQHAYGLSAQSFSKWLSDEVTSLLLMLVGGLLVLWIPYLLLKHARRRWWFYTWLASVPLLVLLVFVEPLWIEPLFNQFGPMQDQALEQRILVQAQRAGIDHARVYEVNKSEDTNQINAYVAGIGGSARIVAWDTTIRKLDADQLLFVLGHEMGHYVLGHVAQELIAISLFLLAALWLIQRVAGWILQRYSTRIGFGELGDIASLPLLLLILNLFGFILTPPGYAYSRHLEHEADRFGLELTRDNHACAIAFVVSGENNLAYPRPGLLYKLWRADHPTRGERIDFCNDYHPWLDGGQGKYAQYIKPPVQ